MKKGISIVLLVIILVVSIAAIGTIIYNLTKNSTINKSPEDMFKTNLNIYTSELNSSLSNMLSQNASFDSNTFNIGIWNGNDDNIKGTIKQYIKSISIKDGLKFEIQNGKLVYVGDDDKEKKWVLDSKLTNGSKINTTGFIIDTITSTTTTMDGLAPAYNNPILPKNFKAVNDGTTWPTDWNKGLVIEDINGNEFVWIPVDGTNVTYEKWNGQKSLFDISHTADDALPLGITSELDQIKKYGGFYIARFEAGKEENDVLVSKKNAAVWNNINYTNAKVKAESMYVTEEIKSGLITGTQWDSIMKWLQNAGVNVAADSTNFGNYYNNTNKSSINPNEPAVSGASQNWKTNNIYDLAGNAYEWTNEKDDTYYVNRGGSYANYGNVQPAMYRDHNNAEDIAQYLSFRVVLYVM